MKTMEEKMEEIQAAWKREVRAGLYTHKSGDFKDFATSDRDVTAPLHHIQFFVPLVGGEVTADFADQDNADKWTDDRWTYDIPTGIFLTSNEVEELICCEAP